MSERSTSELRPAQKKKFNNYLRSHGICISKRKGSFKVLKEEKCGGGGGQILMFYNYLHLHGICISKRKGTVSKCYEKDSVGGCRLKNIYYSLRSHGICISNKKGTVSVLKEGK